MTLIGIGSLPLVFLSSVNTDLLTFVDDNFSVKDDHSDFNLQFKVLNFSLLAIELVFGLKNHACNAIKLLPFTLQCFVLPSPV